MQRMQKEYSDTLKACPHCGYRQNNKVTVFGYTEAFAVNPAVEITKNGALVATVSRNGKVELDLSEPCELKFKSSFRTCKCNVKPGDTVILAFNRVTGGLSATITDQDNTSTEINVKKGKDATRIIWIIAACIGLFLLSLALG